MLVEAKMLLIIMVLQHIEIIIDNWQYCVVMQQFQVAYCQSAPQLQYFTQIDFNPDYEPIPHRQQTDFFSEQEQLHFIEKELSSSSEEAMPTYLEYLQYVVTANRLSLKPTNKYGSWFLSVIQCLVGDILEYGYQSRIEGTDVTSKIRRQMWNRIFGLSFLAFFILIGSPLGFVTACIVFFTAANSRKIGSEIESVRLIRLQLATCLSEIKIRHVAARSDRKRGRLQGLLKDCLTQLQDYWEIKAQGQDFILDRIEHSFFRLSKLHLREDRCNYFMEERNSIKRGWIYWCLVHDNIRIANFIASIQEYFSLPVEQQPQSERTPTTLKKHLYYQVLTQRLAQQLSKSPQKPTSQLKTLLEILSREHQLKRIRQHRLILPSVSKNPESTLEKSQAREAVWVEGRKESIAANYCYSGEEVSTFQLQDPVRFKNALQQILETHQEREQKQKQQPSPPKVQNTWKRGEEAEQRVSFGIGIVPPKRDLSAYYIQ